MTEVAVISAAVVVLAVVGYWMLVVLNVLGIGYLKSRISQTSGKLGVVQCDTIAYQHQTAVCRRIVQMDTGS